MLPMARTQPASRYIFFKGVMIDDNMPTEEMYETQFNDIIERDCAIEEPLYEQIPTVFTSLSDWIKTTNIRCWNCDLNFSDIPVFVPKSIEPYSRSYKSRGSRYIMSTEGCFCSFHCAMAYINAMFIDIHEHINRRSMLLLLFKEFYGISLKEIKPAPKKFDMIQYGFNTVTPYDYRNAIEALKEESGITEDVRNKFKEDAFLNFLKV